MKEQFRNILPSSVFHSLRSIYRSGRDVYRHFTPNYSLTGTYHTYQKKDRIRSILPTKINCLTPTPLCKIMSDYGSDKALYQPPGHHNYTLFYDAAFRAYKDKPIRLFEMGIGTTNPNITHNMGEKGKPGASLRAWKKYFTQGLIYSADIDRDILFEEERIKTYPVDQLDASLIYKMWENHPELQEPFNFIIDDGLHTFEANLCFFENSIQKLKRNGLYIIEDVLQSSLPFWKELIEGRFATAYPDLRFTFLNLPNDLNSGENTLIIIERLKD